MTTKTAEIQELLKAGRYVDALVAEVARLGGGVSFVEVERLLAPYIETKGEHAIELPGIENAIIWMGMSREFAAIAHEALTTMRLWLHASSAFVYAVDGAMLSLPIVKRRPPSGRFTRLHWAPSTFSLEPAYPEHAKQLGWKEGGARWH
jgi:hypothetical protein